MAALARPGSSTGSTATPAGAYTTCPYCRGAVHLIASRCKHCKHDLLEHRSRFGAAAPAALPSLTSLHGAPAANVVAMPAVAALVERSRRRSWMRSWTFWVILAALGAMVAALVLLLWPQFDAGARGVRPPANDRMRTDALPDPWGAPTGPSSRVDPSAPRSGVDPPPVPDLDDDLFADDDDDGVDPTAPDPLAGASRPRPGGSGGAGGVLGGDPYAAPGATPPGHRALGLMVTALCGRAKACRSPLPSLCASGVDLPRNPACYSPRLLADCVEQINALPCDSAVAFGTMLQISECYRLLTC